MNTNFTKIKTFAVILLMFSASLVQANPNPNFYIYLCFGQSNMEGQGVIEAQDKIENPRFKVMESIGCSNLGRETAGEWYTAVPPLCQCYSNLSPADYFGKTMIANLPDSITVGVISVAIGGCDIRIFDKDIYMDFDDTYTESWFTDKVAFYNGNPYQHLMNLAKQAQEDGVIKGILLHQGETNTGNPEWPSYVKKIYNDMLTELSLNAVDVPILAGEVVSVPGNCCASMNTIINRLPDTIPTAKVVSSANCPRADEAHFNSAGYRELGRRYATTMLGTMQKDVIYGSGAQTIFLESECAKFGSNWILSGDDDASNDGYLAVKSGVNSSSVPTDDVSAIEFPVTINATGYFDVYARVLCKTADDDSFWYQVDSEPATMVNVGVKSIWTWVKIAGDSLTQGNHTIKILLAEDGFNIDKIRIANLTYEPSGMEATAANLFKYTDLYFEAECLNYGKKWFAKALDKSSNGYGITVYDGNNNPDGVSSDVENNINIPFTIDSTGEINIYARVRCATVDDDSFWFSINGGAAQCVDADVHDSWTWVKLTSAVLTEGDNVLTISVKEDGLFIDKICITNFFNTPVGKSVDAVNICVPNLPVRINENVEGYSLSQNTPNPTSGITTIVFAIPEEQFVSLKVYNEAGLEISELAGKNYPQGKHSVELDTTTLNAGKYFYVMKAGEFCAVKQFVVE